MHEVVQASDRGRQWCTSTSTTFAVSHGRAILAGNRNATAIGGEPAPVEGHLADERVRALIDFDQPVAVLLVAPCCTSSPT
ncbi:hypothetical protein GCM10020218_049970 [Dactylosporangium vinaceum]